MSENIHPIFDKILNTSKKEELINQHAVVIWMVGLSGSGKSTIARALENELHQHGFLTALLDGDNLRTGINNNLGFSDEDRTENIRRAAEVSKLLASNGVITICSLISPTEEIRQMAKAIIGEKYVEVFIDCPLEECERRDVKGLYAKARKGEIKSFTGIDSPFEAPQEPDVRLNTADFSVTENLNKVSKYILPKIKISKSK